MYGLNEHFVEYILKAYFGGIRPDKTKKDVYLGLGLRLQGATQNLYDFDEVSTDPENTLNYKRVRIAFSDAENGTMMNTSMVIMPTANEDWTLPTRKIQSVGIFNTDAYYDGEDTTKTLIKPLIILQLPTPVEIKAGETATFDPGVIILNLSDD